MILLVIRGVGTLLTWPRLPEQAPLREDGAVGRPGWTEVTARVWFGPP